MRHLWGYLNLFLIICLIKFGIYVFITIPGSQALVSLKKYMPPPLPYFKVNICPLPLPHFASIFFHHDHLLSNVKEAFKIQIIVPMQIIKICSTPNY
jgi:hypothetical protein